MKNFGFSGYDNVIYIGINGKMDEMAAAMGVTNLESFNDFVGVNYSNYKTYQNELNGVPGIKMVAYNEKERNNFQYIVLEIDDHTTGITRDQLVQILHAEKVLARRYFHPGCHRMEPYKSFFPHSGLMLSNTERLSERVLALPTGTAMNSSKIKAVCQIIRLAIEDGRELGERIKKYPSHVVRHRQKTSGAKQESSHRYRRSR